MQCEDNMMIIFKNDIHRRRYEEVAERIISSTKYLDFPSPVAQGLKDNNCYMFSQINWDHFSVAKHPTYKNLTLEFLSSFRYLPNIGLGPAWGIASFRLFGRDYQLNHIELANLLAFQHGPHVYSEVPTDNDMQAELDLFWGGITEDYPHDHVRMNADLIHNHAIRYFKMVTAQKFYGKAHNIDLVSRE